MKPFNHLVVLFLGAVCIAVIGTAGCASTGIQRSEKATTTMATMDSTLQLLAQQLGTTGVSLGEVVDPDNRDLRNSFKVYSANVLEIEAMAKDFDRHADEMNARGKDYFEEWQKEGDEYKNPRIQKLSEDRQIEISDIYHEIAKKSAGVKESLNAYVTEIKEIQIYLSSDLTPKGVEAIAPVARTIRNEGDKLKYAIKDIQTAIHNASAAMSLSGY